MKNSALLCFGLTSAVVWTLPSAHAQSGPPSRPSWHWPLFEPVASSTAGSTAGYKTNAAGDRLIRGTPRPNVWNSHMAFEKYSGVDLHPGIDIRGERGDIVEVPLAGDVVYIQGRAQCRDGSGDKCRMFIRSGDFLYYLGHFSMEEAPNGTMIDDMRQLVQDTKYASGPPDSSRSVTAGTQIGQLENYRSPTNWDHLHISLFDVPFEYDNLDPLRYLSGPLGDPRNVVSGDEGDTLTIEDDERPFVGSIEFVADGGSVNASSVCGQELSGGVDIQAHIVDTFYTSRPRPNEFPGLSDGWNDTIGIAGARYIAQHLATGQTSTSQWYESPIGCTEYACGAWRARFPINHGAIDRGDLMGDNDVFFAQAFLSNGPPVFVAGDVAEQIFDVGRSSMDHSPVAGSFEYIHILTNGATENSVNPTGSWDTSAMPDGPHVVTVEAWDNAGNLSARAVNVNVRNTSAPRTGLDWAPIYAKDHDGDRGQIPSTLGGEPFWASPDILVLPASEPTPTVGSAPRGTKLVVGETYNVYVRAHNPGCSDATGVRARIWVATPGTALGNFVSLGETGTTTVPSEGAALIGPISWTPTEADLDGADEGHRCLVAQIGSDNEPLPVSTDPATLSPAGSSKVVQRNVQTQELEFWVRNVQQATQSSEIKLELEGFGATGRMQMLIERTPEMEAEWDPLCATYGAGSPVTCFHYESWYVLEVHADVGMSPVWPMPGVTQLDARILYELPAGASGKVTLTHYLDGNEVGGMIFTMAGATIIR